MAANPIKGEVGFDHEGASYRFAYSFTAMALFPEHLGKDFAEFSKELEEGVSWDKMPTLFWIGLQEFHPEIDLEAGRQFAREFGVIETAELVGEAFRLGFLRKKGGGAAALPPSAGGGEAGT